MARTNKINAKAISITLPEKLIIEITKQAELERRNNSNMIACCVEKYLETLKNQVQQG